MICFSEYLTALLLFLIVSQSSGFNPRGAVMHRSVFDGNYYSYHQQQLFVRQLKVRRSTKSQRVYLDPEAILDDDEQLLMQLRRQMENNFNASPREITNRIKDFFQSGKPTASSIEVFRSYLQSNVAAMDFVNVILLLEGCSRNRMNFLDLTSWSAVLDAMERPSGLMTSSMIYRGVSCIRAVNMNDPAAKKFVDLLCEQFEANAVLLHANDICPAIYSMQSLPTNTAPLRRLMQFCAKSMAAVTAEIPAKPMCSAIYGLKKQKPTREVRLLLWEIANRIEDSKTYYHSVNVCIALNGLQGMDDSYPEVRRLLSVLMDKAIDANEQGIDRAGDREISMALFGLQRMGITGNTEATASFKTSGSRTQKENERSAAVSSGKWESGGASITGVIEELIASGGSSAGTDRDYQNLRKFSGENYWINDSLTGSSGSSSNNIRRSSDAVKLEKNSKLRGAATQKATITPELRRTILYIISLLEFYQLPFEAKRLSFAILGLLRMSAEIPETRRLLELLSDKAKDAWGEITGHELSMTLHGLMGLQSDTSPVRSLIGHIVPIVERCPRISAEDARSGIFGLQGMYSAGCKEVSSLFSALADLLERSEISFNTPGEVANVLYGIQGLDISSTAGRKMVKVIDRMAINGLPAGCSFTGREIAMCIYGLRNANANCAEALDLLSTLTKYMKTLRGQLSANDVATILYGLQNFRTFFKPMNQFVEAMAEQMIAMDTKGGFNPRGVSMALNGLQGMDSNGFATRRLLVALSPILERTEAQFKGFDDFHQLASGFYGLSSLKSNNEEVNLFLMRLLQLLKSADQSKSSSNDSGSKKKWTSTATAAAASSFSSDAGRHVSYGLRQPETPTAEKVAMALYGLQGLDPALPAVDELLTILASYCEAMPAANCRALGMSLQLFKNVHKSTGSQQQQQQQITPTAPQQRILSALALKLPGWSTRKLSPARRGNKVMLPPSFSEVRTTIRSSMTGIERLDVADASVQSLLSAFAVELLAPSFDLSLVDASTFNCIARVYLNIRNQSKNSAVVMSFSEQPEIASLIAALEVLEMTMKLLPQAKTAAAKMQVKDKSRVASSSSNKASSGSNKKGSNRVANASIAESTKESGDSKRQ